MIVTLSNPVRDMKDRSVHLIKESEVNDGVTWAEISVYRMDVRELE